MPQAAPLRHFAPRIATNREEPAVRARSYLLSFVLLAWLDASPAAGGTLTHATWVQTLAGVDLTVTNAGATCTSLDPSRVQQAIDCPATGLQATGSAFATGGLSGGGSYSVALTMPLFAVTQFTTGGAIDVYTKLTFGDRGPIVIAGGTTGPSAKAGVGGMRTVKNAVHVATGASASRLAPGGTTLVRVPLSVGNRVAVTALFYVLDEPHYLTVFFYGWTPNTWIFYDLSSGLSPLPDVTAMGSFAVSPGGAGTVTLVSPSLIHIDGPLAQRRTASSTTLKLTFVPEPSALLLLGAAAAGLWRARG
jgi:hypothetical protein